MSYKYRSPRSTRKLASKSRQNFIITLIITGLLLYFTFQWVLPSFIGGVSFIKETFKPQTKISTAVDEKNTLAPPVLNISYEATNTAQIDIAGFGTPNSKVKLFLDDIEVQTTEVPSEGNFVFSQVSLTLGTNNIYGKTIDDKEKVSLPSKNIKIYFDDEKPALNIAEPEDSKQIQGGDKKVRVAGKTEPDAKIFINGSQQILDNEGNFASEQPLNEGDNMFSIQAVDLASNTTEIQRKVTFQP